MVRCRNCGQHEYPKVGKPGATWSFNGDRTTPTFSPSMNELVNGPGPDHRPDIDTMRCHFTITNGMIQYHDDCTHELRGVTATLQEWPQGHLEYYETLLKADA